jgi:mRNA interferase MazF
MLLFTMLVGLAFGPTYARMEEERIMERKIRRGDMYFADLPLGVGSEQFGYRPIVVIQNETGNKYSRTTVVAAIVTSRTLSKAKLPTHCHIKAQQGLGRDSLVLLEQIRTIDKTRLREYIGTLDNETMSKVDKALVVSVGLNRRRDHVETK